MKLVTNHVSPDEPAYGLFEGPKNGRWLQQVFVIRGDSMASYETDYGPASEYEDKVVPLVMPSFGDDKVGELMAYAEKNRYDRYWANRREEILAGSTLIEDHLRLLDEETQQLFNKSVFGPAITVQRNNSNRQFIQRYLKEKLNGHRS